MKFIYTSLQYANIFICSEGNRGHIGFCKKKFMNKTSMSICIYKNINIERSVHTYLNVPQLNQIVQLSISLQILSTCDITIFMLHCNPLDT